MNLRACAVLVFLAASIVPASAQGVTDAQIAAIVVTANQVDIDAGKLAAATATDKEVKAFGRMMVTSHTGVNKQATELVTRLKVTPEENPTGGSLKAGGAANVAHLKTVTGMQFDREYIDHEVAYHQQVLDAIDKILIPSASNQELKSLLVSVRPAIAAHLEHARMLQSKMNGTH